MLYSVTDMTGRIVALFPTLWEAERKASILNMGSDTNSFKVSTGNLYK
jgi:hypothetical protein